MDRYIKWILLASLLVNAALVGFLSAQFFRGPRMFVMNEMPGKPGWPDDNTRKTLDKAFEAERPALDAALREMFEAREKSVELLRAEKLDIAALDAAGAAMRSGNDKAMASFHRAIKSVAESLSTTERQNLARILDRGPPRMFDRDFKVFGREPMMFFRGPGGGPGPGGFAMPLPPGLPVPPGTPDQVTPAPQ
jgi:uncharacterized membrane protein